MSCVTIGSVKGKVQNTTRTVDVPCLTKSVDLEEGEELIIEVPDKDVRNVTPKRAWRTALEEEEEHDTRVGTRATTLVVGGPQSRE